MIEIKNLGKALGGKKVIENTTSTILPGSIYGLIGSNGAGKSTLLNLISGVYKADAGGVFIDGEEIYENTAVKNRIAYIADELFYFNSYSMKEMAEYLNIAYPSFSMAKFYELTQHFPLDKNMRIGSFSKGMKRQAAVVFALSQNPDILLCDECFDGLDPVIRQLVKKLIIKEVADRNMTVIISSHSLREMENLCDIIGILHNNSIILEKSIDDIKDRMHKIQLALKPMISEGELPDTLDIVKCSIKGNMMELVARGDINEIQNTLDTLNPLISEQIPITLEDIFIYEMEVTGYDFAKILV